MEREKKTVTPEQAYARMTRICARKEYAPFEIRQKLQRLQLPADVIEALISRLINERYIDERRFAESYIRDKLQFNKWGRRKIELHLAMKKIPPAVISDAFAQFSESQLNESLQTLLEKKRRSITGRSDYERNGKLIRYALGRGFPMEEIIRCLEKMDIESYPDDPQ